MKRLAVAALTLAVLVTAAWFLSRREVREQRAQRTEARLLQFDERDVRALVLTTGGSDWRFERRGAGWRLVSPLEDAADGKVLEELLSATRGAEVAQVIDDPEPLAAYGLEPPRGVIRLDGVDAPALDIGDRTPANDGLYARVEGRPGVLVLDWMRAGPLTLLVPEAFRDHRLSDLPRVDVQTIDIRAGSSGVRLELEDGSWWITAPFRLPADGPRIDRLFGVLERAEVAGFLDGASTDDPRFGLGARAAEVVLGTASGPRTFRLGNVEGAIRFVRRSDRAMVLAVAAQELADLPLELDVLAARRLTNVNRYKVRDFTYRRGPATFGARRTAEGGWVASDGRSVDDEAIYSLLVRILEAGVEGWRERGPAKGAAVASFEFEVEGSEPDRIEFFADGSARVASLPRVSFILASPLPAIPAGLTAS